MSDELIVNGRFDGDENWTNGRVTMSPDEATIRQHVAGRSIPLCGWVYIPVFKSSAVTVSDGKFSDREPVKTIYMYKRENSMVFEGRTHRWTERYAELNKTRVFLGHDCNLPDSIRLKYSPPLSGEIAT